MPWKETCAVDQRLALVADWLRQEWTPRSERGDLVDRLRAHRGPAPAQVELRRGFDGLFV